MLQTQWRNVDRGQAAALLSLDHHRGAGIASTLDYIQSTRGTYAAGHDGSKLVRYDHKVGSWQIGRVIQPLSWKRASATACAILAIVAVVISWGAFELALRSGW